MTAIDFEILIFCALVIVEAALIIVASVAAVLSFITGERVQKMLKRWFTRLIDSVSDIG